MQYLRQLKLVKVVKVTLHMVSGQVIQDDWTWLCNWNEVHTVMLFPNA